MKSHLVKKHGLLLEARTIGKGAGNLYRYEWNESEKKVEKMKCYRFSREEKVSALVRDYLELLDVHETDAGYVHGVYNLSEKTWKTLKDYRKLSKMSSFPDLESIENGGERIKKVQDFLENLEAAERNPFLNLEFLPYLSHKVENPRTIVREAVLDALSSDTSVRTQMIARTLGGDEEFEETLKEAREELRERIEIARNLLDLIGSGIRRDDSPKSRDSQTDLETFSS